MIYGPLIAIKEVMKSLSKFPPEALVLFRLSDTDHIQRIVELPEYQDFSLVYLQSGYVCDGHATPEELASYAKGSTDNEETIIVPTVSFRLDRGDC